MPAPKRLAPALERLLQERQAERLPSVSAAVVRDGEVVWSDAVGLADCESGREATAGDQYRIGSITKTFTAVAVMQLRDAGLLDLDDRIEQHVPVPAGSPTIRRMLSHLSGYQREPGDMWVSGEMPTMEEMLEAAGTYEFVFPAARAHHYSNLAYGFLGEAVARLSGMSYTDYVDERVIGALGLTRTTWHEHAPNAQGYLVDEFARTVTREPHTDLRGTVAMGQLWSTVGDLAQWATFLRAGREGVLAPATIEEMWAPQVMYDPKDWSLGWGLGLMLHNRNGRIFGGHGGAMPGFLAAVVIDRKSGTGAAVLTNSGTRGETDVLALALAERTLEEWPEAVESWRPEQEPPADVRAILGRWWSEGNEFVFWWEAGALRAQFAGAPSSRTPAIFEREGVGWRVKSGRELGERLRAEGDQLVWAGYVFTRDQQPTPA